MASEQNDEPRSYFDDTDDVHESHGWDDPAHRGVEVFFPVGQKIHEFVQPGYERDQTQYCFQQPASPAQSLGIRVRIADVTGHCAPH